MAKGGSRYQPEEGTLMSNGKKAAPPPKTGFRHFLYNSDEGTVLGRTAKSWFQILVFYIIFYTLLALFWLACLKIFLSTIDLQLPRFYGQGTIIGVNPGVGYQPWLRENPESTLIKFNVKDPQSYDEYVNTLDAYLAKYKNLTDTRVCSANESNRDIIVGGKVNPNSTEGACRFDLTPFERAGCSKANFYGFRSGQPCVILSLNRLIGWAPEDFADGEIPDEVRGRYKSGNIAFDCDGTYEPDKEYLGERLYIPKEGIDGRFYPYAVMDNYHQPIAMVKFNSLPVNRVIQVECRAYAKNIEQDIESRLGLVHFELLREDFVPKSSEKEL